MILFVLVILGAAILIGFLIVAQRRENQEVRKRLEDEFLFDRATGLKITLEQAEQGYSPENHSAFDKENKGVFLEEEELAYIENELKKYFSPSDPENAVEVIEASDLFGDYMDLELDFVFNINDAGLIGLITVAYEDLVGKTIELLAEPQLFLIIHNYQQKAKLYLEGDLRAELVGSSLLIKSAKTATRHELRRLMELFRNYSKG